MELIAIIFYSILFILLYINRKKFEWVGPVYAYRKKELVKILKKYALKHSKILKIVFTIGIFISIYYIPFSVYTLYSYLQKIITKEVNKPGVSLLIPGVKIPGSIYVPFLQGIIAIGILAVVHEFSHAIASLVEKIKVKSIGFGFLLFLPVAFAEVDEKELEKASLLKKLRILSAGPFANIALAFIVFFLVSISFPLFNSIYVYKGVNITKVMENYPAFYANISEGEIILGINNNSVRSINDLIKILSNKKPGDTIILKTNKGEYKIKLADKDGKPFIGVELNQLREFKKIFLYPYSNIILEFILSLLTWIATLNFLVGIVNFLPIFITDGGRIVYETLRFLVKNQYVANIIYILISSFTLLLILANMFLPYFI